MSEILNWSVGSLIYFVVMFVAVSILILAITRAFWCWFFKTSEIARLLEEISTNLKTLHNLQIDIQRNEYEWRKAEWEQKHGKVAEEALVQEKNANSY